MFLKPPAHNVFNYQPSFYDKKKEDAKKRQLQNQSKIKGAFTKKIERRSSLNNKANTIRLLIILGFVGILSYYIIENRELIIKMIEVLLQSKK